MLNQDLKVQQNGLPSHVREVVVRDVPGLVVYSQGLLVPGLDPKAPSLLLLVASHDPIVLRHQWQVVNLDLRAQHLPQLVENLGPTVSLLSLVGSLDHIALHRQWEVESQDPVASLPLLVESLDPRVRGLLLQTENPDPRVPGRLL